MSPSDPWDLTPQERAALSPEEEDAARVKAREKNLDEHLSVKLAAGRKVTDARYHEIVASIIDEPEFWLYLEDYQMPREKVAIFITLTLDALESVGYKISGSATNRTPSDYFDKP